MATINVDEKKEVPDSIIIKSKEDLKAKLERGLEDIKNNRVYSLDEVFAEIEKI